MTTKKRKSFTRLPCGLRLRLSRGTTERENFELRGDMGQSGMRGSHTITRLSIDDSSENLMALAAFFLARAREVVE